MTCRHTLRPALIILLALMMAAGIPGRAGTDESSPWPRVYRTFMPEAGPSAFAVLLSPELALCYDPLRGGINEAWHGGIDLSPTMRAKINQAAAIDGEVFYRETAVQPLRPGEDTDEPRRRFKGYHYEGNAVIFEFTLNDITVLESIRPTEDGRGIERHFRLADPGAPDVPVRFLLESQSAATVTADPDPGSDGDAWHFTLTATKAFVIRVLPKTTKTTTAP